MPELIQYNLPLNFSYPILFLPTPGDAADAVEFRQQLIQIHPCILS